MGTVCDSAMRYDRAVCFSPQLQQEFHNVCHRWDTHSSVFPGRAECVQSRCEKNSVDSRGNSGWLMYVFPEGLRCQRHVP